MYQTVVLYCLSVFLWAVAGCQAAPKDQPPVRKSPETAMTKNDKPAMPPLNDEEKRVLLRKGTERAFTGKYWDHFAEGVYICRNCGAELYTSTSKFRSDCGWPSFDDEIKGAVKRLPDADGRRTEILCAACGGHLGHVFLGEAMTPKNTRHCVNSVSIVFVPAGDKRQPATQPAKTEEAIFAGGCFWGVEHHLDHTPGVLKAESGYTGGTTRNPTYREVCTGKTGHAEAVRVTYDPAKVSYEHLARLFFETHDPTTVNRQGPDAGTQYRSAVFYKTPEQKATAEKLIKLLKDKGYKVVTELQPAGEFYVAEDYHQDYLDKNPDRPSCHVRVERFEKKAGQ